MQKCSSVLFIELGQPACLKSDLHQDTVAGAVPDFLFYADSNIDDGKSDD